MEFNFFPILAASLCKHIRHHHRRRRRHGIISSLPSQVVSHPSRPSVVHPSCKDPSEARMKEKHPGTITSAHTESRTGPDWKDSANAKIGWPFHVRLDSSDDPEYCSFCSILPVFFFRSSSWLVTNIDKTTMNLDFGRMDGRLDGRATTQHHQDLYAVVVSCLIEVDPCWLVFFLR